MRTVELLEIEREAEACVSGSSLARLKPRKPNIVSSNTFPIKVQAGHRIAKNVFLALITCSDFILSMRILWLQH